MSLSCSCDYSGDPSWYVWVPDDYSEMPEFKRRKRCSSCGSLIDTGSVVAKFERTREPRSDIEEAIYGEGDAIQLADQYLCETCADLFFSLREIGFTCVMPDENMRDLVREYAESRILNLEDLMNNAKPTRGISQESTSLLPCPFCGGNVHWCLCGMSAEEHEGCHQITCPHCGNFDFANGNLEIGDTLDELRECMAKKWNTRAI